MGKFSDMARDQSVMIIAVDPIGCGCTECLVGEYKPITDVNEAEAEALLLGLIRNNTGMSAMGLGIYFDDMFS